VADIDNLLELDAGGTTGQLAATRFEDDLVDGLDLGVDLDGERGIRLVGYAIA
jgi:hypothetical protein